jgi:hypothetical protein
MIEIIRRIVATKWTDSQKIVALYLVANSKIQMQGSAYRVVESTAPKIAAAIGLSDRTVRDTLDSLVKAELIEKYITHSKVNRHGQPVAPIRHRRPRWGDHWTVETTIAFKPKKWPKILPTISKGKTAQKTAEKRYSRRKQFPPNIQKGMKIVSISRDLVIAIPDNPAPDGDL